MPRQGRPVLSSVPSVASVAPRRRGRPRQFDADAALDAALRTFWRKGFQATSLDDLTAATGLNRPSLYAAFGNKDALYAAAIARYVATIGRAFLIPLAAPVPLAAALRRFFAAVVATTCGAHGPLGCAIACTLPADAGHLPALQRLLAGALAEIDGAVQQRLVAARAAGELPPHADPRVTAQLVVGTMLSLAIRARAGAPRRELTRIASACVALVTSR